MAFVNWVHKEANMRFPELVRAIKKHSGMTEAEIIQAGQYGADAGWAGFTYTADAEEFYENNKDAIWEVLQETADEMGMKPMELVASFKCSNMAETPDGFANLLAWFALEEAGRWLECRRDT